MKYSLSEIKTFGTSKYTIPSSIIDNLLFVSMSIDGFVNTRKMVKGEDYVYIGETQEKKKDNWDTIRNFNTTKFNEIVKPDVDLKGKINKITENNYTEIVGTLAEYILSQSNQEELTEHLLDIFSRNSFFSKTYAKCIAIMNETIPCISECIQRRIEHLPLIYETFEYVSDKNYEKFCINTKLNEERKSIGLFYTNISIHSSIISKKTITDIIELLLDKIKQWSKNETRKNEIDEIVENIFILYKCLIESEHSSIADTMNSITETMKILSISSTKIDKGLTNKSIFKFMDMIDLVG